MKKTVLNRKTACFAALTIIGTLSLVQGKLVSDLESRHALNLALRPDQIGEFRSILSLQSETDSTTTVSDSSSDMTTEATDTTTTNTTDTTSTDTTATEETTTETSSSESTSNSTSTTTKAKAYNILSIDGGGIRGVIPTQVIDYMENYAYNYSVQMGYIEENTRKKFPMKDMFDMVAGTSTGGIVAAALVTPNKSNGNESLYYADDMLTMIKEHGPELYKRQSINTGLLWIITVICGMIGGVIGFRWGKSLFSNPKTEKTQREILNYIKQLKKKINNQINSNEDPQIPKQESLPIGTRSLIANRLGEGLLTKYQILNQSEVEQVQDGNRIMQLLESEDYWQVKEAEKLLMRSLTKYKESKQKKWIIMSIFLILGALIGYFGTSTVYFLTQSKYDRTNLDALLAKYFGNIQVSEALSDEVFLVSYSYNAQEPRFYSKYYARKQPEIYNVSMQTATAATSASPLYFDSYVFTNPNGTQELLVDGEIIANNPSLYAWIMAVEKHKHSNIRVVSLGTGITKYTKIDPNNTSVLSWLSNLQDLVVSVEVTTHEFFTEFLVNSEFHRFQVRSSKDISNADGSSLNELLGYGQQLIAKNETHIQKLCETILDERYGATII